jgi:aminoglycoside phosphotransferase (APT) family kinase protein
MHRTGRLSVPDTAEELQRTLEAVLLERIGHPVTLTLPVQLSGGASKESWSFDLIDRDVAQPLILRRDPPGATALSHAGDEHGLLDAVRAAGVPAPRVLWSGSVEAWRGATFIVMERVEGETLARRILRDPEFAVARSRLLGQVAQAMAHVHAVDVDSVVPHLRHRSSEQLVDDVESMLDSGPNPHPVFELALRWLRANQPVEESPTVVHADFRMGNLIVGTEGLRSVIDWELSHVGDPIRDLGYFCVRSWRFGADDKPAGGIGSRHELVEEYQRAGGRHVDMATLRFWEVYGTTVWGAQTGFLTQQFLRDGVRSVELAAIGRRAVEMEHDVLTLLGHRPSFDAIRAADRPVDISTQDRPLATELLLVTGEFLRDEVMPQLDGTRTGFHVRVAANVLGIVERELALAPHHALLDREAMAGILGARGQDATLADMIAELAARIRRGELDGDAELGAFLAASTARKLSIANPGYLATTTPEEGYR